MSTAMIHVAVVDDYAPIRRALQRFFEHEPSFQWVGGVADAEEAIVLVTTRHVDALILDLSMPGLGGLAALPRLRIAAPHVRVVVLSAFPASIYAHKARELGASNYLEKAADLDLIAATIRIAMTEASPSVPEYLAPRD
jgi:two-component system, NarL family, response regulator LiaR